MKKNHFLLPMLILSMNGIGQISITVAGLGYTENFNTLAISGTANTTLPAGWFFSESGTAAGVTYAGGTGSSTTGDTYSFGTTGNTERALGGLQTGSLLPVIGANFINNTGSSTASLSVSYTGEQWRLGASGRTDRLNFQYSTDATSLVTGTWTDMDALDLIAPNSSGTAGALDGNLPVNRVELNSTFSGLSIANGSSFWLRWTDFNATGSDDGLGIDDFSITIPSQIPTPVFLVSFSGFKEGNSNQLRWSTATELNNLGFEVQRSSDGIKYTSIGFVNSLAAGGNSNNQLDYYYTDIPIAGSQYYRLRQVDFDRQGKLSSIILIKSDKPVTFHIDGLIPNPASAIVNVIIATTTREKMTMILTDINGRTVLQKIVVTGIGINNIPVNISWLRMGTYLVRIICSRGCEGVTGKFIKQ